MEKNVKIPLDLFMDKWDFYIVITYLFTSAIFQSIARSYSSVLCIHLLLATLIIGSYLQFFD